MKKMSLDVPKPAGKSGPKFDQAAKGASLVKGVSHLETGVKVDSMYSQPGAEKNQLMPKGADRV